MNKSIANKLPLWAWMIIFILAVCILVLVPSYLTGLI
jgi:hypothetical protein